MAAVYIVMRQVQDRAVCKPEFQELVIRIVLQMLSSYFTLPKEEKNIPLLLQGT